MAVVIHIVFKSSIPVGKCSLISADIQPLVKWLSMEDLLGNFLELLKS